MSCVIPRLYDIPNSCLGVCHTPRPSLMDLKRPELNCGATGTSVDVRSLISHLDLLTFFEVNLGDVVCTRQATQQTEITVCCGACPIQPMSPECYMVPLFVLHNLHVSVIQSIHRDHRSMMGRRNISSGSNHSLVLTELPTN